MLPLVDLILSEREFYLALGQAAEAAYYAEQESSLDMKEFWAWKGTQALQQYFMHALSQNVEKVYGQRPGLEKGLHRAQKTADENESSGNG